MKRFFSIAACMALAALATLAVSCQKDGFSGNTETAVFSVVIPDDSVISDESQTKAGAAEAGTRAALVSDGSLVDKLYYEVYAGEDLMYKGEVDPTPNSYPKAFTFNVKLVKGMEYQILFWAQCSKANHYSWETLKAVNVSYAGKANDETRDAFFGSLPKYTVTSTPTTVKLTRPFAQVNFASSSADWKTTLPFVTVDGGLNLQSKIVMQNVPDCFNVSTADVVSGKAAAEVVFDYSQAPVTWSNYASDITYINFAGADTYKRVAMTYILASKTGDNLGTVNAYFVHNKNAESPLEKVIYTVPVKQNYRTNILGNIFSGDNAFNVVICPGFKGDIIVR